MEKSRLNNTQRNTSMQITIRSWQSLDNKFLIFYGTRTFHESQTIKTDESSFNQIQGRLIYNSGQYEFCNEDINNWLVSVVNEYQDCS